MFERIKYKLMYFLENVFHDYLWDIPLRFGVIERTGKLTKRIMRKSSSGIWKYKLPYINTQWRHTAENKLYIVKDYNIILDAFSFVDNTVIICADECGNIKNVPMYMWYGTMKRTV